MFNQGFLINKISKNSVFNAGEQEYFLQLFKRRLDQNRSTATFHFELAYDYKKLLRWALLYGKKRVRKYGDRPAYKEKMASKESKEKDIMTSRKQKVYLPYIVNNTWARHPQRNFYVYDF